MLWCNTTVIIAAENGAEKLSMLTCYVQRKNDVYKQNHGETPRSRYRFYQFVAGRIWAVQSDQESIPVTPTCPLCDMAIESAGKNL